MGAGDKSVGRPKKGQLPKRDSEGTYRETILYLKGSNEYFRFVNGVHDKSQIPKAQMFRLAFAEWCEKHGHGTPPPI